MNRSTLLQAFTAHSSFHKEFVNMQKILKSAPKQFLYSILFLLLYEGIKGTGYLHKRIQLQIMMSSGELLIFFKCMVIHVQKRYASNLITLFSYVIAADKLC